MKVYAAQRKKQVETESAVRYKAIRTVTLASDADKFSCYLREDEPPAAAGRVACCALRNS
jgi:hypothetical protein